MIKKGQIKLKNLSVPKNVQMGTMGELMCALEEDRVPENSVQDYLVTPQALFATIRSIEENHPVWLKEIN
jgi:hypothetical protein